MDPGVTSGLLPKNRVAAIVYKAKRICVNTPTRGQKDKRSGFTTLLHRMVYRSFPADLYFRMTISCLRCSGKTNH